MNIDAPMAIFSIKLLQEVTGKKIIELVEKVCEENYGGFVQRRRVIDDQNYYLVGQESRSPYKYLLIAVEKDEVWINKEKQYNTIKVISHNWGGMVHAIGYDDSAIIESCREFRDLLKKELNK